LKLVVQMSRVAIVTGTKSVEMTVTSFEMLGLMSMAYSTLESRFN